MIHREITYLLYICLGLSILPTEVNAITLVYNMKIRSIFTLGLEAVRTRKSAVVASAVPIVFTRKGDALSTVLNLNARENRVLFGSLVNVRYIPSRSWWLEATTGFEKEILKVRGTPDFAASRIGVDDIVLSGGYNIFPHKRVQCVFYGLTGFPTRRKVTLEDIQGPLVGTRFFAAGVGSEVSYIFVRKPKTSLVGIFQNRFLHFFERKWEPILPPGGRIEPGNLTDLLFAIKYRIKKLVFDVGYNPTFFTNQALSVPGRTFKDSGFVRHGIFASFVYLCKKCPIIDRLLVIGAGFLHNRTKKFNNQTFSYWLQATTVF